MQGLIRRKMMFMNSGTRTSSKNIYKQNRAIKYMKKKRGLSDIVTTLLFVLLALGAVMLVWTLVRTQLTGSGSQIEITKACLDLGVEPVKCEYVYNESHPQGIPEITILYKRGNEDLPETLTFEKINLILEFKDGTTGIYVAEGADYIPGIVETKGDTWGSGAWWSGAKASDWVSEFSLAPVLVTETGEEKTCPETARIPCRKTAHYTE